MNKVLSVPLVIMLSFVGLFAGQAPLSDRLVVTEKSGSYELAVPVSRLFLTIPKGQLRSSTEAVAAISNPRYFSLNLVR
jgi:hypothetical protein